MQRLSQVALDPLLLVCAVLLLAFLFYWKTAHLRFTWRGFLLMLVPTAFILISSAPGIVNRLLIRLNLGTPWSRVVRKKPL